MEPQRLASYRHTLSNTRVSSQAWLSGMAIEQASARDQKGQWRVGPGIDIGGENITASVNISQYAGESRGYSGNLSLTWKW